MSQVSLYVSVSVNKQTFKFAWNLVTKNHSPSFCFVLDELSGQEYCSVNYLTTVF